MVVARNYQNDVVEFCEARLDKAVALHFSPSHEIEPDTCSMLEDTVPANEIQIIVRQVALGSPLSRMPAQRHFCLKGHCSSHQVRLSLNYLRPEQLDRAHIMPATEPCQQVEIRW